MALDHYFAGLTSAEPADRECLYLHVFGDKMAFIRRHAVCVLPTMLNMSAREREREYHNSQINMKTALNLVFDQIMYYIWKCV